MCRTNLVSQTFEVIKRDPLGIFSSVRTSRVHIENRFDLVFRQEPADVAVIDESQVSQFTVTRGRGIESIIFYVDQSEV